MRWSLDAKEDGGRTGALIGRDTIQVSEGWHASRLAAAACGVRPGKVRGRDGARQGLRSLGQLAQLTTCYFPCASVSITMF